ncbi:hypothetical protein Q8W71_14045 [Methylobacterium sp. NEAU 140]|uniref:hypothetical protein n=1 Tax=Methylobacterium sp. NEAU 140 TaxID=3064945 RepID=UPI002733F680|nr:hypothetical protein [Methylobacterium sp. NEAU 140]MDP4023753.1 hypothetical protein [Methylobacterium sp. NEAU 140]
MVDATRPANSYDARSLGRGSGEDAIDWLWMLGAIRQKLRTIVVLILIFSATGAAFVLLRGAHYTAQTQLLLTNLRLTFSRDDALFAESVPDPSFLETQMQIMRSDKIALVVVDRLNLANKAGDEDANTTPVSTLLRFLDPWGQRVWDGISAYTADLMADGSASSSDADQATAPRGTASEKDGRRFRALKELQRSTTVERVGMSNIVAVRYTTRNAEEAAVVANEIARAYVDDQVVGRVESAQSASIWLRERLRDVGPKTRIIAYAIAPTEKSDLRGILIIALSAGIGAALGVTYALIARLVDRTVSIPEQVIDATGVECLGVIPRLRRRDKRASRVSLIKAVVPNQIVFTEAVAQSRSPVGRAMGHAKAAIDTALHGRKAPCIGVTSASLGEGKTTVAHNLAMLIADWGHRVLVIRCRSRDEPSPAALKAEDAAAPGTGVPALSSTSTHIIQDALDRQIIEVGGRRNDVSYCEIDLLGTDAGELIQCLKLSFDYIICDLAPLDAVGDVRCALKHLDGVILVVEWRAVHLDHLRAAIRSFTELRTKLVGTVLNKVDLATMQRSSSPLGRFFVRYS